MGKTPWILLGLALKTDIICLVCVSDAVVLLMGKGDVATNPKPSCVFRGQFPCQSLILFTASLVSWLLKQRQLWGLVIYFFTDNQIWAYIMSSLLYGHVLWPQQKINTFSISTSTSSIYIKTESAIRQCSMKSATVLSPAVSLFFLFWLIPCNTAVCKFCIYLPLVLFTTTSFCQVLCVQRLLSASKHFFLPSHLTIYCLLKVHQPILKQKQKQTGFI